VKPVVLNASANILPSLEKSIPLGSAFPGAIVKTKLCFVD
jgi:hypothetical protein